MPLPFRRYYIPSDESPHSQGYFVPGNQRRALGDELLRMQSRSIAQLQDDLAQLRQHQNEMTAQALKDRHLWLKERKENTGQKLTMVIVTAVVTVFGTALGSYLLSRFAASQKAKGEKAKGKKKS